MKIKLLDKKAFTLIELIVVIVVLVILMLLAAPKVLEHVEESKLAHIKNDVKVAEIALSEYLVKNETLPDEWLVVSTSKLKGLIADSKLYDKTGYTQQIPEDTYREIDKEYIKKATATKLGGKFYVNEKTNKVYYENDKPSKIAYKEPLYDREVQEHEIDQDKINILNYVFPNGIYHNGETMRGNMKFEGKESDDYTLEVYYIHSKFGTALDSKVDFHLAKDEIKTVDFSYLVEPYNLRGFYDIVAVVKDSEGTELAEFYVKQTVYFAETEWIYYYEDDFNEMNRPVAGQLGALSPDRVTYTYVDETATKGIDYSSITFDVEPNDKHSGQIHTILPETYGTYEAMIKVPDSKALLNGFFLYGHESDTGDEHEIDIEILYYEGKWQLWGTIFNATHPDYVYNGEEPGVIYQSKIDLPFDPSKDYHSYRIDFYDDYISFAVDGNEFGRWENKFDYGDMHLHAGNFYSHWLTREFSSVPLEMNVEWIRKGYFK